MSIVVSVVVFISISVNGATCIVVLTNRRMSELFDASTDDAEIGSGARILHPALLHH